ncbi:hypothetical protein RHGRI_024710 [Rhododendron griersonianum]|uniref:Uncharacterized protein n=2 Tax=Rhododendron griersonianum TaxID=479676 RepID=A0AAV6JCJ0_9ERIC|nr:hypothetical protein RHGRI_024710 [Rhododendron griersonianum]
MQTPFSFLNIKLAMRAPHPALALGHLPHQQILPPSLIFVQLPKLLAPNPRMPPHVTTRAEQPMTHRALALRDQNPFLHHHHRRAVLERAVKLLRRRYKRLAQHLVPPRRHVRRDDGPDVDELERAAAVEAGAGDQSGVGLDPGGDVLGHAVGAEGVGAGFDEEHVAGVFLVGADFAEGGGGLAGFGGGGGGFVAVRLGRSGGGGGLGGDEGGHEGFLELELFGVGGVGDGEELVVFGGVGEG